MRSAKKLVKGSPEIDDKLTKVLSLLQQNPFTPSIKTHSLSGQHKGKYACSLTEDLRVVFKLHDNIIHLLDIGTHDEVY